MKRALITGINGQDGSYLAELLLSKGYEVHGIVRREAIEDPSHRLRNITHILDDVKLHVGSVDNHLAVYKVVNEVRPEECYHLAASSFVSYSFDDELSVLSSNFNSTHYLLASIKELTPACRFYFSGSSEMFGEAEEAPQNEATRFNPRSVYGISKLAGHHLVSNYRRQHKVFACTGILYNHESPRRGYEFVTRKVASAVAKIRLGLLDHLEVGNIDARRDWGYAPDYVDAMYAMLQHREPEDFVVATGALHSVKEFLHMAFSVVGLDYRQFVRINPEYFRPGEAVPLCGDSSKAKQLLGWCHTKNLKDIVEEMVLTEIADLKNQQ